MGHAEQAMKELDAEIAVGHLYEGIVVDDPGSVGIGIQIRLVDQDKSFGPMPWPARAWSPTSYIASAPVWTGFSYGANWSNFGSGYQTGQYWKDDSGIVHLHGLITRSGGFIGGETMLTLPVGFRPTGQEIFACDGEGCIIRVDILTNGVVQLIGPSVGTAGAFWVSMNGITFDSGVPIAAPAPPAILMPSRGDRALFIRSDQGLYWCVAWWPYDD